jgi:hypothetical protein
MEDWTKLLDVMVVKSAGYPATIWNLVVDPRAVFEQPTSPRVGSAGLTYIFTALIYYAFNSVRAKMEAVSSKMTPSVFITLMIAYVAIIVNAQQYFLSKFDIGDTKLEAQLEALVYAFCPALLLASFVLLIGTMVRPKSVVPVVVMYLLCNPFYFLCLYNVSTTAFHLPTDQALKSALVMWGLFALIVIVGSFIIFLIALVLAAVFGAWAMVGYEGRSVGFEALLRYMLRLLKEVDDANVR